MHAVVLLPGNVFKCLFFVYFEWMFLLNKHQSWRDSQIQTDPKMSIFRLAGICTVSLPKHRTSSSRTGTVLQIHFHRFLSCFLCPYR